MNKVADINTSDILRRCVSVDLEVDPEMARIFAFAAVVQDPEEPSLVVNASVEANLLRLDSFCQDSDHVIGHNILRHDP